MQADNEVAENVVAILANDNVIDWLRACLRSLRGVSPDIECWIIPFDDRMRQTTRIADRQGARIVEPPGLRELQAIGSLFCPDKRIAQHVFRKIAALFLPARRILFSDADVIFLKPVEPLFAALRVDADEVLYADSDMSRVYADEEFASGMVKRFGSRGINTGFWLTRGGRFRLEEVQECARMAESIACHFDSTTMEQPFLNFLFDTSGVRAVHLSERIEGFPNCSWGALPAVVVDDVPSCVTEFEGVRYNKASTPLHMMHWAGVPIDFRMPNRDLFLENFARGCPPGSRELMLARLWSSLQMQRIRGARRRLGRLLDYLACAS
jgi:hypothetical protein